MVTPCPELPRLGSLLDTMAKRSPFGSQEKSVTVSVSFRVRYLEDGTTDMHRTFELDNFNGKVLLAYTENLKAAEYRSFRLCVSVDAYTEKVVRILPI